MPETQGKRSLPGILAAIVETKRREIEDLRERGSDLERAAASAPEPRDFAAALRRGAHVALIAECKRRSPGAGDIRPDVDPAALAVAYASAGAAALSVLTDLEYFGGSLDDLRRARGAVALPVLRKDFTLDPVQVVEARAAGADAVLLIVRLLTDDALAALRREAEALGMAVLVEAHDRDELRRAVDCGATIVGINNRDLATFTTDLDTTLRLLDSLPNGVTVVSESGIRTAADVARLGDGGVDAILVGETLLRAPDPGEAAAGLSRIPRRSRG